MDKKIREAIEDGYAVISHAKVALEEADNEAIAQLDKEIELSKMKLRVARIQLTKLRNKRTKLGNKRTKLIPEKNLQRVSFIREVLACNPHVTLQAFADIFGLTRERVRQLMSKAGISTGQLGLQKATLPRCMNCRAPMPSHNIGGRCQPCRIISNQRHFTCGWCGAPFTLRVGEVNNIIRNPKGTGRGPQFCSYACKGKTVGMRYGFGNPEHPIHTDPNYPFQNNLKPARHSHI